MKTFFWDTVEAASIAWGALKANRVRATLATLGIVIGVMTVVLMVTIVAGLNASFKKQLSLIGAGTVYVTRFPWIMQDDFFLYRNRPRLTLRDAEAIHRESLLAEAVTPSVDTMRPVSYGSTVLNGVFVVGAGDDYQKTENVMPEVGRFLSRQEFEANRSVVVIGQEVADRLFSARNPIGQEIRIGAHRYRIIGVLEKQGTMFGMSLDNQVIIPLGTLMKHFGRRRDLTISVKAAEGVRLVDLKDELTGILRRSRKLGPGDKDNFSINERDQLMATYNKLTAGVYAAGIIIGGISLLVGGIGIMNIMLVSVTERTHEIGIRKALGARRSQVLRQFLIESALICAVGGIIGVGLARLGGAVINQWLPTSMPISVAVGSMAFAALVGIFFGLYPAAKAARLDPITALRKE
ncbi:MAG: FtsX-like permease family protein [Candidatus Zixiibacteriota bacterium]|nr:MAG: FtsX-like permease family protein [candidate division Zixibacteria bacterium]